MRSLVFRRWIGTIDIEWAVVGFGAHFESASPISPVDRVSYVTITDNDGVPIELFIEIEVLFTMFFW